MSKNPRKSKPPKKLSAKPLTSLTDVMFARAMGLHQQGKFKEAQSLYEEILALQPNHFDALHLMGVICIQLKDPHRAVRLISQAIDINRKHPSAHSNLGKALYDLKRYQASLESCDRAVGLKADYAEALNNRGNALRELKRYQSALDSYDKAVALLPGFVEPYNNRGTVLGQLRRYQEALDCYDKAIALKPDYADAYYNRGAVLLELGRYREALLCYDKVIAFEPSHALAHNNRGTVLRLLNRHEAAIESYDQAIVLKIGSAEAYFNRGMSRRHLGQLEGALHDLNRAVEINPEIPDAYNDRGIVLTQLHEYDSALESFDRAINLKPDSAALRYNRGYALRNIKDYESALQSYEYAASLEPEFAYSYGIRLHTKLEICDWTDLREQLALLLEKIERNEGKSQPFSLIAMTDLLAPQLNASLTWASDKFPGKCLPGSLARLPRHERIRIGYYSADYWNHATAYLIAELFERHDREKFELIGFSFGPSEDDPMRQRLAAAFDQFIDVRARSDKEVAMLSRELEVDIAVDLKGYTLDSRMGIFAERVAPIQVSYLGYPGTTGADYIDYLIADPTLIPTASQAYYSEKIAYLPDSYQVNDRKRQIADKLFTRAECELPEDGFVFCCFNNNYKILPDVFDIWMRLLRRVEGSVLWLFEGNAKAASNLRQEAARRGVNEARLVFAPRLPVPEHLARHRLADLFLDTLPCNAHTTASDALWAGLPVLTCMGEAFASRVAASLLNAIRLPELITESLGAYEALALELALNRQKLAGIRQKLQNNRLTTPLFDTALFTKHIEAAYTTMYERYQADLPAECFYV